MNKINSGAAAKAVSSVCKLNETFDSVCTDTRKIVPGCLFVCLKGEKFDGNEFASAAIEKGAVAVICDRDCGLGDRQIVVENTGRALLSLAAWYRSQFKIPVVGVTGSVGKTTTKEMIACVMRAKYKTLKNEGNLNNEIGVPITLFGLDDSYNAAVIEMGMNHFGEIDRLTNAVKPTCAVISNIGVSHIENLGSREGILKAKLEILNGMAPDAPLIVNADNDMLGNLGFTDRPLITFGIDSKSADYRADNISFDDACASFDLIVKGEYKEKIELPVSGLHNILNALAAVAVGDLHGVTYAMAKDALSGYETTGMRQKTVLKCGITFIEDCYNASPDSQKAALTVLGDMKGKRKIAVLGDMLELGSYSRQLHETVGGFVSENKIDILLTFGENSVWINKAAESGGVAVSFHFDSKKDLSDKLFSILESGDAVLFKASRGMKFEEIISDIYSRLDSQTGE